MCGHVDVNGHDMWREEINLIVRQMANDLKKKEIFSSFESLPGKQHDMARREDEKRRALFENC
ncbi:hypothetical protein NECAME_14795 [Necator americanus]|uniref:Uncharacterized protein n=1 Tax=Necator americanus TaxID=51031 RepID=W2SL59_NECAM|nr:hypothetical protein NECAME_14795 [Necator americanus]ETN70404.1 hypothetical protein NECAME_14795 [Necator americanus]